MRSGEQMQPGFSLDQEVSAAVPDWSRESTVPLRWEPSRALLGSLRSYQRCARSANPLVRLLAKWAALRHRFWSAVTGTDIPLTCRIGGGLLIPHPNGIVIHPDAVIGPNCLIFQQVTIGATKAGVPTLGGHVDIGAGAKLLGAIHVGDHAVIGANAVVLSDVPPGSTAVGVPARVRVPLAPRVALAAPAATVDLDLTRSLDSTGLKPQAVPGESVRVE